MRRRKRRADRSTQEEETTTTKSRNHSNSTTTTHQPPEETQEKRLYPRIEKRGVSPCNIVRSPCNILGRMTRSGTTLPRAWRAAIIESFEDVDEEEGYVGLAVTRGRRRPPRPYQW
jgi:hypothetical protein